MSNSLKERRKVLQSFVILVVLGVIWGTGYSIARFAMTNGVPPLGYSYWQSIGPALILSMCVMARKDRLFPSVSRARFYLISGLTAIAIPNTCMYFAAAHLPAGILATVVNTVPIFAYPLALIFNLEKFNWERMLGILIAIIALLLIVAHKTSLPSPDMIPWVLATLITPLSFALSSIYIARYRPANCDSLTLSAGMLTASAIMLLPLVLYSGSFYHLQTPLTTPDFIILLEIILSTIGYILFFQLLKIAGPVYYSLVDTIVVLTGVTWGYLIFNEHLNAWTGMAVILIIISLMLVTRNQRKAANV